MMFKKDIHYSRDLEQAILGAFLIEQTAFGRCFGIIDEDVFYHDDNKVIFSVIKEMWDENERIDILTVVAKYCKKHNTNEIEGCSAAYVITKLINAVVSTANLEAHSFILKQMYIERELIKITHNGIEERTDVLEQVANLETKLRKITQISSQDDFKTLDDAFVSLYKHMDTVKDKDVIGITTGFKQLDKITGGLMPGGMYVVAARPSVGKSAFMGRMVIGAAKQGKQVGIISLEMNNEQISARLASLTTEVEFWRIYRNRMMDQEQQDDFYRKMNKVARLPISISENAVFNINVNKAKVSKLSHIVL